MRNEKSNFYDSKLGTETFVLKNKEKFNKIVKKTSFSKKNLIKFAAYFNKRGLFIKQLTTILQTYGVIYSIFVNYKPHEVLDKETYKLKINS